MILLNVQSDIRNVMREIGTLQDGIREKATADALNKTIAKAKTGMAREIASVYNLSATKAKERLVVYKAQGTGKYIELTATLKGTGKRSINVIAFGAKQTRKGTSVKIKKSSGRKVPHPAWAAGLPFIGNKGRTVFARVEGKQAKNRPGRLTKHSQALRGVTTIDVPQMFNQKQINAAVRAQIQADFPAIFANSARFYLDRFKSKGF